MPRWMVRSSALALGSRTRSVDWTHFYQKYQQKPELVFVVVFLRWGLPMLSQASLRLLGWSKALPHSYK